MRVLVTGASGFIGSEVVRQLAVRGHDVQAISVNWLSLFGAHELRGTDTIVHCGWGGVSGSERNDPSQANNVMTAWGLMFAAHEAGVRNFIGIGSHAEYGPHVTPLTEHSSTHPTTLYGASKLATYHLLDRLAAIHGIRFAWARVFNAYGPGDSPAWLIPSTIDKLLRNEPVSLTKCDQTWEYTHVRDVAAGIVALAESPAGGVFNLSSGDPWRLADIVRHIAQIVGGSEGMLADRAAHERLLRFGEVEYRPDQVMCLQSGTKALQNATGWQPRIWLSQGLHETVKWHREQMK